MTAHDTTTTADATTTSTRHAGLDRDDVVEAALDLVTSGGAAELTMRKLAARLGVTTTTIYWHVGNRDRLVLEVVRRQAERQARARVEGSTPQARIESAAANIWRNALAHRHVTALANQAGATTLLELPLETTLVAELEAAGVRGDRARDALRSILACIAGFLVLAWRSDAHVPTELRAASLWATVDDPRLSDETLAALREPPDLDRLFATTVQAVVAGILTNDADADADIDAAGARGAS